ncbi:MAG: S41 family peptidase [Anaerolineae bacterium]|nr:S41 family peptidase [Anaerolineae bacterium]
MRDSLKISLVAAVLILVVGLSFAAGFMTNGMLTAPNRSTALAGLGVELGPLGSTRSPDSFKVFWEAWDIVQREYYGQVPSDQAVTYGALRGALGALNDPNTTFLEPRAASLERSDLAGQFEGIGATVQNNTDGRLVIVSPVPGSPAEQAGLQPNDVILKVDGREMVGVSSADAVTFLRGPKGTSVTLTIQRDGGTPFDVTLTRTPITMPTVTARTLEDVGAPTVGYVRLKLFGERSAGEVQRAIQDLRAKGAQAIVLDMRNNPGGYLTAAIDIASQFIGDGVVVYERHSDGREEPFRAKSGGTALDIPMVVLVNAGSASASEIVAGAIRDRQRGKLVGTKTFGKGSVQNVHQLSDQSTLHVTVAHWLTPERHDISKAGLEPDVVVEQEGEAGTSGDRQLQRAVDLLMAGR